MSLAWAHKAPPAEFGYRSLRFEEYLDHLTRCSGHVDCIVPMENYMKGLLLLPLERKSVEPMAACLAPGNLRQVHQSPHHIVADAAWSGAVLLKQVREQVLLAMTRRHSLMAWIVDDTGFPRKGSHSVGVARQYCGQVGKQQNGRIAFSVSLVTEQASQPARYQLYLPENWAGEFSLAMAARFHLAWFLSSWHPFQKCQHREFLSIAVKSALRKLGSDLRDARLRRRIPVAVMAQRAFIPRTTLVKLEKGDPGVAMGTYAAVLFALGMIDKPRELASAKSDAVGIALEHERLPKRIEIRPRRSARSNCRSLPTRNPQHPTPPREASRTLTKQPRVQKQERPGVGETVTELLKRFG
jgi:hypothetical protein